MSEWGSFAASLCVLLACGYPVRAAGKRVGFPPAVSLIGLGMILGPELLDWLSRSYLQDAGYLSKAAFVVLLLRVGLGIALRGLKWRVPRVIVLGLIPAIVELAVVAAATEHFLFHRWDLALLSGFLIAAVSPAVILPTMLDQKDKGRGSARLVPDQIMGMAVINAFLAQTGILILLGWLALPGSGESIARVMSFLPLAIGGGAVGGFAIGHGVSVAVSQLHARSRPRWVLTLIVLCGGVAVYFAATHFGLESVIATLAVGVAIRRTDGRVAAVLRDSMRQVWGVGEVILFAGLGAMLDLGSLTHATLVLGILALLAAAVGIRIVVAWLCTVGTDMRLRERFYISLAQIPKATVQAVFAPVISSQLRSPSVGLPEEGQILLLMAVLGILATAPVGAVVLDRWGGRLLPTEQPSA